MARKRELDLFVFLWLLVPCALAAGQVAETSIVLTHDGAVTKVQFDPSGKPVLLTVAYGAVLWDTRSGDKMHTFEGPRKKAGCVASLSPDGTRLLVSASGPWDRGPATLYDATTFEELWQVEPREWGFMMSVLSPGGKYAVVSRERYHWLLDARTGEQIHELAPDVASG